MHVTSSKLSITMSTEVSGTKAELPEGRAICRGRIASEGSSTDDACPCDNNNTTTCNCNKPQLSDEDIALLRKLEEANRLIESDSKALNALTGSSSAASGHSRRTSESSSQFSVTSGRPDEDEDLWTLWGNLVADWENVFKKKNGLIKELVRKGVPHHFRGVVWPLLCGANDSPAKQLYAQYIKSTSACEKIIRRDIARTYPEHDFFKEKDGLGQESLFNVMKAYSLHDREVGYCQGSAFIVGLLLMQMPEEEAFAVSVKLMQEYGLREMFKPSMAQLGLCIYQLKNLVEEFMPDLQAHFLSQGFDTSMYASSWFLTLYTTTLTLPVACRVMDAFLADGMEVIFRVALAILVASKEDLLFLDMEGMLKYFQKEAPVRFDSCPDLLISSAYSIKLSPKRMRKLEKEYITLKTKEQEGQEEFKRLRAENRILRQKVTMLETESSQLADRLIRGQVSRADQEETAFQLQRELETVRQHDAENTALVKELQERLKRLEKDSSKQNSLENASSFQAELLMQKEELVQCLQEQLIGGRLRQAEMESLIRDLKAQLQDSEEEKKRLREAPPDEDVAKLQEELIAVKLREAEATLAVKELRPKISELTSQWLKHLQDHHSESTENNEQGLSSKKLMFWENNKNIKAADEELMTSKLREMEAVTEVKELRLRVMELETQNQVMMNQLKRRDDEVKSLQEKLDLANRTEKEYQLKIKDHERKYIDLEVKMREELMLARIRDAENSQQVAELMNKISHLQVQNQEILVEGEISLTRDDEKLRELQDRVAELTAEIQRLEQKNPKTVKAPAEQEMQLFNGEHSEDDEDLTKLKLQFPEADI